MGSVDTTPERHHDTGVPVFSLVLLPFFVYVSLSVGP